jgi:hypothetical protein
MLTQFDGAQLAEIVNQRDLFHYIFSIDVFDILKEKDMEVGHGCT